MNIEEKLSILAESAKYDASCSSSGSNRKNEGGMGKVVYVIVLLVMEDVYHYLKY